MCSQAQTCPLPSSGLEPVRHDVKKPKSVPQKRQLEELQSVALAQGSGHSGGNEACAV